MSLQTRIKVGNITNLSDARYCAGMGVDMLGFKLSSTDPGGVSANRFKEIASWISGPEFVLELSEFSPYLNEVAEIGFVEVAASQLDQLKQQKFEGRAIVTIDLKDWSARKGQLIAAKANITYLLLTNTTGLADSVIKANVLEMRDDFAVLLGISITVDKLAEYLAWPIAGLALNGSEETSPGLKNYDHLSSILEHLEVD